VAVAIDGAARAGMGVDTGDYDEDGRLDLVVTNLDQEMNSLYRGLGDRVFTYATPESGIGAATLPFVGFGAVFLDFDNDTRLDLAFANGHIMDNAARIRAGATYAQRNLLFRNTGASPRFVEIGGTAGPGFALVKVSRGLVAGDIDNDGDLDLLVTNNGQTADLLRNDGGNAATPCSCARSAHRATAMASAPGSADDGTRTQMRDVKRARATSVRTICGLTSGWARRRSRSGSKSSGPAAGRRCLRTFLRTRSSPSKRAAASCLGRRSRNDASPIAGGERFALPGSARAPYSFNTRRNTIFHDDLPQSAVVRGRSAALEETPAPSGTRDCDLDVESGWRDPLSSDRRPRVVPATWSSHPRPDAATWDSCHPVNDITSRRTRRRRAATGSRCGCGRRARRVTCVRCGIGVGRTHPRFGGQGWM
jgi:hypothetical protein